MEKESFHAAEVTKSCPIPLASSTVAAGFPAPAEEQVECNLDLNDLIIKRPAATFFVRAEGDSMIGAGIAPGDLLVVDRSLSAEEGSIVIAVVSGEFTVKKLSKKRLSLEPANPKYSPIPLEGEIECQIWGVVTHTVRNVLGTR